MDASAAAARRWTDLEVAQVDEAIRKCAYFQPYFTADDIWERLPKDFPVTKGLGYTKQSLYVPAINLLIGRLIYQAAVDSNYRCPWSPWSASGNYCK